MNHSELADNDMDPKREKTSQQEATADGDNRDENGWEVRQTYALLPLGFTALTGKGPIQFQRESKSDLSIPRSTRRAERRAQILHTPDGTHVPPIDRRDRLDFSRRLSEEGGLDPVQSPRSTGSTR